MAHHDDRTGGGIGRRGWGEMEEMEGDEVGLMVRRGSRGEGEGDGVGGEG